MTSQIYSFLSNTLSNIKQNVDWMIGSVYGTSSSYYLMYIQPDSSVSFLEIIFRTVLVTVVAFFAKKVSEWMYLFFKAKLKK